MILLLSYEIAHYTLNGLRSYKEIEYFFKRWLNALSNLGAQHAANLFEILVFEKALTLPVVFKTKIIFLGSR